MMPISQEKYSVQPTDLFAESSCATITLDMRSASSCDSGDSVYLVKATDKNGIGAPFAVDRLGDAA
jgi:hypothetical protein